MASVLVEVIRPAARFVMVRVVAPLPMLTVAKGVVPVKEPYVVVPMVAPLVPTAAAVVANEPRATSLLLLDTAAEPNASDATPTEVAPRPVVPPLPPIAADWLPMAVVPAPMASEVLPADLA
jgi:hypothetical protein